MYYPKEESNEIVLIMTNEESLLDKEYSDNDFNFINYVSYREIIIERHKEVEKKKLKTQILKDYLYSK